MKVIIAGSRSITGAIADRLVREALLASGWHLKLTEVVSGQCDGIDIAGERWAKLAHVPVQPFPAQWKKYGLKAGPIRNGEMAAYADALIAIPGGKGTRDMIAQMEALGKPVYVHKGE